MVHKDGIAYVIGGSNGSDEVFQCEQLDVQKNKWTSMGSMLRNRSDAAACVLGDIIYVFGGEVEAQGKDAIQYFSIKTQRWKLHRLQINREIKVGQALQISPTEIAIVGGGKTEIQIVDPIACTVKEITPSA